MCEEKSDKHMRDAVAQFQVYPPGCMLDRFTHARRMSWFNGSDCETVSSGGTPTKYGRRNKTGAESGWGTALMGKRIRPVRSGLAMGEWPSNLDLHLATPHAA